MTARTRLVVLLLFGSGFCALTYQTTWLREFRLVFGVSTAATAAVVGIFMAGMGLGEIFLGRRSERASQPLRFYAKLEGFFAHCEITHGLIEVSPRAHLPTRGVLATSHRSKIVSGFFNTALRDPFIILNNGCDRMTTRLPIATYEGGDVLWQRKFLEIRKDCYNALHDPRAAQASRDVEGSTVDMASLAHEIQTRSANRGNR